MRSIVKLSLACIALGAASACKSADLVHPTETLPYAGVRFLNAVPDSAGVFGFDFRFVDILESNAQFHMTFRNSPTTSSPFTSTLTEFKGAREGSRHFRVFLDDTLQAAASTVLVDTTVTLVTGTNYTGVEWGEGRVTGANGMHFNFWAETVTDPGTQVALRVLNTTNAAIDVRAYLSGTAGAPASVPVTFANVAPFTASAYVTVAPGSYVYNVVPAGSTPTGSGNTAPNLFADATTLAGAAANCDGQTCLTNQHADIDPSPGTTVAGSAVTGVVWPRSTAAEPNPTAPTATLAAGAGNIDNGPTSYKVSFVTGAGETGAGAVSATVTVVDKTVAGQINLTNIPVGSALVLSRNIYRLGPQGFQFLTNIPNNTATTYLDNTANASLGTTLAPAANSTIKTPQSAAFTVPQITFMWDRRPPRSCAPYC